MILIRLILLSAISATVLYNVSAQSTSLKYGDPTKDELGYQVCPFDSSAGAVIFFKYAKMYFLNGQMNYDVHVRMKILKEEGLAAGEIALPYLAENNFEDITNLKAQITHPVSSGKPVVQRVSNFPDETVSKQVKQRKIIFPDVKVGAILEYSFTRKSFNFILPDPWVFDDEYPVLLSFMTAEIPATLNYKAFYEGERAFNAFARTPPIDWTWTLRNLPALRDEPFTDNKLNYANKIILQLAGVHSSTESDGYATKGGYREFNLTWETLAKEFLASDALASYTGRVSQRQMLWQRSTLEMHRHWQKPKRFLPTFGTTSPGMGYTISIRIRICRGWPVPEEEMLRRSTYSCMPCCARPAWRLTLL